MNVYVKGMLLFLLVSFLTSCSKQSQNQEKNTKEEVVEVVEDDIPMNSEKCSYCSGKGIIMVRHARTRNKTRASLCEELNCYSHVSHSHRCPKCQGRGWTESSD